MEYVHLHIQSLDFDEASPNTPIWGKIYVDINGRYFPDFEWYDAVSSVLGMWAETVIEFVHSSEAQCDLYFMDGPFLLNLSTFSENDIVVSFKSREYSNTVSVTVRLSTFIRELLDCVYLFVAECQKYAPSFTATTTYIQMTNSCDELRKILSTYN